MFLLNLLKSIRYHLTIHWAFKKLGLVPLLQGSVPTSSIRGVFQPRMNWPKNKYITGVLTSFTIGTIYGRGPSCKCLAREELRASKSWSPGVKVPPEKRFQQSHRFSILPERASHPKQEKHVRYVIVCQRTDILLYSFVWGVRHRCVSLKKMGKPTSFVWWHRHLSLEGRSWQFFEIAYLVGGLT